ncbi:unnamed protein product, partial [Chrysoparadoxa australica]
EFFLAIETTGEQREIWNSCQFDQSSSLCFNESITIEFIGELNQESLLKSLDYLIERHASLRSCFSADGKHMMIHHRQKADIEIVEYEDINLVADKEKEQCLTLFDLGCGPLIRFVLCVPKEKSSNQKSYLILTAHHVICDGWSWAILTSDLGHFYNCEKEKVFRPLQKAAQYWSYSKFKTLSDKSSDRNYWKKVFSTPQSTNDYHKIKERPSFRTFNSIRIDTPCSESTIRELRSIARKNKLNLYQFLLTAFFMTLSKKAKEKDITVGISQAGQTNPEFSSLVGHCVGLLPIRVNEFENQNFESNFSKVRTAMLDAQKHSALSFGDICEIATNKRDPSRVPLVPITFNLDVQPVGQGLNFSDLKCRFTTNPRYFENFEMFINLTLIGDRAVIENQFNTDLYTKDEIINFQETYKKFLNHLAEGKNSDSFSFDDHFKFDQAKSTEEGKAEVVIQKPISVEKKSNDSKGVPIEFKESLLELWKNILLVNDVSDQDGFFELGGHSLLVTEMILAVRERLKVTLTMKDLFLNQKFDQFCRVVFEKSSLDGTQIRSEGRDDTSDLLSINPGLASKDQNLTLSWQQQRTWLFQKLNPESTLFNLPSLFQFKGDMDVNLLAEALIHFQKSHPLISSKLKTVKGMPYWVWNKSNKEVQKVEIQDLKKLYTKDTIEEIIKRLVNEHTEGANKAFDMDGNLYQAKIYFYKNSNGEDYTFLAQKVHHIIWDGWCYDIFLDELEKNYRALLSGEELPAPLDLTYFDYAKWQSELPKKSFYNEKLEFWKNEFKDTPDPLDLPIKPGTKRGEKKFEGKSLFIKWEEEMVVPLETIARDNGTTLFNLLLTTFKLFLNRYTGQTDITVGTPVRGRDAKKLDKVIGFFVNNIAIRSTVDSTRSFEENLNRVAEKTAMAFENGLVPFDVVVREVDLERDPTRTPLYQAFFMYQDATNRDTNFCGAERSSYRLPRGACHTDIDFWARRDREGMIGGFDFDSNLFNQDQMERMASDFEFFLSEISTLVKKKEPVSNALLLSDNHREFVLKRLNQTNVSFSSKNTIADLISNTALKNSSKVAIRSALGEVTYGELNSLSDALAQDLINRGVKPGQLVGMALPRHHFLPICLLGIIKAGAGYVPLDPTYPEDRLSYMIENSKLDFVICDAEDEGLSIFKNVKRISLGDPKKATDESPWMTVINESLKERKQSIASTDTCYVIYTSGSTGLPKGVDISHQSMVNFIESMIKVPGIDKNDTLIAVTTMSFDIAVLEMYCPLVAGATLYVCTKEESMFGDALIDVIKSEKGTFLQATPATWRQLVVSGLKEYTKGLNKEGRMFKSLCGGEPLPSDLKEQILDSVDELWNMYGPTETTVWSTCHQVKKGDSWISIGKPIDNTQIYILSENLELCPYGGVGELCIGGDGLARGYLNRPELTSERFVPCPALGGKIVYRTGDLGRYREDGLLECLGRNDGQVKVRGFRIELGEIESIISQTPGIESQVVIVREDRPGDARIVAYFIKSTGESKSEKDLCSAIQQKIKENLPFYMMPSHFVEVGEFPLTLNGKIDRKKLPSPMGSSVSEPEVTPPIQDSLIQNVSQPTSLRSQFEKIWMECLNTNSVSDEDDFFKAGGHSLLSVTLFSRIETDLGITLPLSTLFQKTTF